MRSSSKNSISALLRASVSPWLLVFTMIAASHAQEKITFRDITAQAGIHFTHNNGAFGKKWLPETMGPGCAFIDYDNDGYARHTAGQRSRLARTRKKWCDDVEALPQQP